jgi:hypothetical protein
MTEALFSINHEGQLMSATYYSITSETLERKLLSDELIGEVLQRASKRKSKAWNFNHEDVTIEIIKKYKHKIEFFVSRDIQKWKSD